jgi:hypothetical protein
MRSFRNLFLLIITVATSLNSLSQERGAQSSKAAAKGASRFQNLFAEKPIDIKGFDVNSQSQLSLINLRALNLSQKSSSKQSIADEAAAVPKPAKPIPNRLGEIGPLEIKSDWANGIEQKRAITLRSFDAMSSRKRDLSDVE